MKKYLVILFLITLTLSACSNEVYITQNEPIDKEVVEENTSDTTDAMDEIEEDDNDAYVETDGSKPIYGDYSQEATSANLNRYKKEDFGDTFEFPLNDSSNSVVFDLTKFKTTDKYFLLYRTDKSGEIGDLFSYRNELNSKGVSSYTVDFYSIITASDDVNFLKEAINSNFSDESMDYFGYFGYKYNRTIESTNYKAYIFYSEEFDDFKIIVDYNLDDVAVVLNVFIASFEKDLDINESLNKYIIPLIPTEVRRD